MLVKFLKEMENRDRLVVSIYTNRFPLSLVIHIPSYWSELALKQEHGIFQMDVIFGPEDIWLK